MNNFVLFEINDIDKSTKEYSFIDLSISNAELELDKLNEDISTIRNNKAECDKIDYTLAASSGVLCGLIDIFFVGKPNKTSLGEISDKSISNIIIDFARKLGWEPQGDVKLTNAISWLEKKFDVPYDQTSLGEAAKSVFGLNTDTSSHHFESLAHNPSILGLVFSIIDQFNNESHFVIDGRLITLVDADGKFKLKGSNWISKIFCGFINWFGHLISDVSGSGSSARKGNRGMGIPSPLYTWINDIIVIKRLLGIEESEFDKSVNQIAVEIFNEGFDLRFQAAQTIPVILNEIIARFFYSTRRLINYYSNTPKMLRSFNAAWKHCKPYGNLTVNRMLMVAHGTFFLIDIGDATVRSFIAGGGHFNGIEFLLRLNLAGLGRLTISLYGEIRQSINYYNSTKEIEFIEKRKSIVNIYIDGLKELKQKYNDDCYLDFINDISNSKCIKAFDKTVKLARLREVSPNEILTNLEEIDVYFGCNQNKSDNNEEKK